MTPSRNAGRHFRRAVTLTVLTLLAPGSAQYFVGNRRVGRLALRCWLTLWALVAVLAVLAAVSQSTLVGLASNAGLLRFVQVMLVVGAVAWFALFLDTWRLGRPMRMHRKPRLWTTGLTGGVAVLTSAVLLLSSHYMGMASASLSAIFSGTTVHQADAGRYNILLLGADAGTDRVGLRPDSMTLASINEETGRTVLFSFPRNLQKIPFAPGSVMAAQFPDGFTCGPECLLNAVYTWGDDHKNLWPHGVDAGIDAVRSAIEGVSGLPVHYYAIADMDGFSQLVDAVGGVDVSISAPVPVGGNHGAPPYWLLAGRHHLNGAQALGFARSRSNSSDYSRMSRQKCLMTALLAQADPTTVLTRFQQIATAGRQLMRTDLPASQLSTFLDLATRARSQPITSVAFIPPLVDPVAPDFAAIWAKVQSSIAASDTRTLAATPTPTATPTPALTPGPDGTTARPTVDPEATPTPKATPRAQRTDQPAQATKPTDAGLIGNPDPESDDLAATCSAA